MDRDTGLPDGGHAWVTVIEGPPVVHVPDQVDFSNAAELEAALASAARDHATLVVDMSQTAYCDSSGLSTLVRASRTAAAGGGHLLIAARSPSVLRVLAITGLDRLFQVHASLPEVIAAIPASAKTRSAPYA